MRILELFKADVSIKLPLPFALDRLSCGFTSPAEDHIDQRLDLNEHLIRDQNVTFFGRAIGDSMIEANIHPDDIVIVDKSISPQSGSVVLAVLNGGFVIKRLRFKSRRVLLVSENPRFPVREILEGDDFYIWGVVTYTIHRHLL